MKKLISVLAITIIFCNTSFAVDTPEGERVGYCSTQNSVTLTATNGFDVYYWEVYNGSSWVPLGDTNSDNYKTLTRSQIFHIGITKYRLKVEDAYGELSDYSDEYDVYLISSPVGGTISRSTSSVVCSGTRVDLTLNGMSGNVSRWEYRVKLGSDGTWSGPYYSTSSLTTQAYNLSNTSSSTKYYEFQVIVDNGCGQTTSSSTNTILVHAIPKGTLSRDESAVICHDESINMTLSNKVGNIELWQQRTKIGTGSWSGWSTFETSTSNSPDELTAVNTSVTDKYYQFRARIDNGVCSTVSSNVIEYTVNPDVYDDISISGDDHRVQGSGNTVYTTDAINATEHNWVLTPSGAGSISSSGSTGSTGTVTWNSGFTGSATVSVEASGQCGVVNPQASLQVAVSSFAPPTALPATEIDEAEFRANWSYSGPATTFELYVYDFQNERYLTNYNGLLVTGRSLLIECSFNSRYYYHLRAVNDQGDKSDLSNKVNVISRPSSPNGAHIDSCEGTSVTLTSNTLPFYDEYLWYVYDGSTWSFLDNTRADPYKELLVSDILSQGITKYRIIVENTDGTPSGTSGSYDIRVRPLPFSVTGGIDNCVRGNSVAIGLSDSQEGYTYQLKRNGSTVVKTVSRMSSGSFSFGSFSAAGGYTATAYRTGNTSCSNTMTGYAQINTALSDPVLNAGAITASSITVNWAAVTGAVNYTYILKNGDGSQIRTGTTTSRSVVLNSLVEDSNYTIEVRANGTNCPSISTSITKRTLPSPPTALPATEIDEAEFRANWSYSGTATKGELYVYNYPSGDPLPDYDGLLVTGTSLLIECSFESRYYYELRAVADNGSKSELSDRVYVSTRPSTPDGADVLYCAGDEEVTLTSTGGYDGYVWYLYNGSWTRVDDYDAEKDFPVSYIDSNGFTKYKVAVKNVDGVESDTSREYDITKMTLGTATAIDGSRCRTGAVIIRATPGSNGTTIRWYDEETEGTLLKTYNSYTTPSLLKSQTYYAVTYNSNTGCEGLVRVPVEAVVNQQPPMPPTPTVTNECDRTVLTRDEPYYGETIYYWQSLSSEYSTDDSSKSVIRTEGTKYHIKSKDEATGCWSDNVTVTYDIDQMPASAPSPRIWSSTNSSVTIYWDPVDGADSYTNVLEELDGTQISSYTRTEPNATIGSLERGQDYRIKVRSNGGSCQTTYSSFEYSVCNLSADNISATTNTCSTDFGVNLKYDDALDIAYDAGAEEVGFIVFDQKPSNTTIEDALISYYYEDDDYHVTLVSGAPFPSGNYDADYYHIEDVNDTHWAVFFYTDESGPACWSAPAAFEIASAVNTPGTGRAVSCDPGASGGKMVQFTFRDAPVGYTYDLYGGESETTLIASGLSSETYDILFYDVDTDQDYDYRCDNCGLLDQYFVKVQGDCPSDKKVFTVDQREYTPPTIDGEGPECLPNGSSTVDVDLRARNGGASTYQWFDSNGEPIDGADGEYFTAENLIAGNHYFSAASSDPLVEGCYGPKAPAGINVHPRPVIASANGEGCNELNIILSASPSSYDSYTWFDKDGNQLGTTVNGYLNIDNPNLEQLTSFSVQATHEGCQGPVFGGSVEILLDASNISATTNTCSTDFGVNLKYDDALDIAYDAGAEEVGFIVFDQKPSNTTIEDALISYYYEDDDYHVTLVSGAPFESGNYDADYYNIDNINDTHWAVFFYTDQSGPKCWSAPAAFDIASAVSTQVNVDAVICDTSEGSIPMVQIKVWGAPAGYTYTVTGLGENGSYQVFREQPAGTYDILFYDDDPDDISDFVCENCKLDDQFFVQAIGSCSSEERVFGIVQREFSDLTAIGGGGTKCLPDGSSSMDINFSVGGNVESGIYQWFDENGVAIPDENGSTYTAENLPPGEYAFFVASQDMDIETCHGPKKEASVLIVDWEEEIHGDYIGGIADTPSDLNFLVCPGEQMDDKYEMDGLAPDGNMIIWYTKNGNEYTEYDENYYLSLDFDSHPVREEPYTYYHKYLVENPWWGTSCNFPSSNYAPVEVHVKDNCDDKYNRTTTKIHGLNEEEENIVLSASKSYFDLGGQPLQSQGTTYDFESKIRVMVTQPVYDQYNRPAIQTMSAPRMDRAFQYDPNFIRTTDGTDATGQYNSDDFNSDGASAVDDSTPGTLGWYYSVNNTLEEHVPLTSYPFSQSSFYEDGSGETKSASSPGDALRMGLGHDPISKILPAGVLSLELPDYAEIRQLVMPGIEPIESVIKKVVIDQEGKEMVSFEHEAGVIATAQMEGSGDDRKYYAIENGNVKSIQIHVPSGGDGLVSLEVTGAGPDFKVYDKLADELDVTPASLGDGTILLAPGIYELVDLDHVLIAQNYFDFSYNFYDNTGRLTASMSPEGLINYRSGDALSDLKYTSFYYYDFKGNMVRMVEPDAGETHYLYRKDGSIRFSQNALQAENSRYSYTLYDGLGRPIESGEYTGSDSFASRKNPVTLELTGAAGAIPEGEKVDWVKTSYDLPDDFQSDLSDDIEQWYDQNYGSGYTHASGGNNTQESDRIASLYEQDFLEGAVSFTENASVKTWYSYDEFGQVTFIVTRYNEMDGTDDPRFFRLDYQYDYYGNVIEVASQKDYVGESFYHHYTYNKNQQLTDVHTSQLGAEDPNKYLHATYEYYLHGPLKRVIYAEDLQGLDYVYTAHGALKAINSPLGANDPGQDGANGVHPDAFGMELNYFSGDDRIKDYTSTSQVSAANSLYDGNIQSTVWGREGSVTDQSIFEYNHETLEGPITETKVIETRESITLTKGFNNEGFAFEAGLDEEAINEESPVTIEAQRYSYSYDIKNQLEEASYQETLTASAGDDLKLTDLSYDANGNIETLRRYDDQGNDTYYKYDYVTAKNQLDSVRGYADYQYNAIGQMTASEAKSGREDYGDQYYQYDVTGKVVAIYANQLDLDNQANAVTAYTYDDRGFRIMKSDPSGKQTWYVRDASGNIISIYEKSDNETKVIEMPIYGSGKIGTSFVNDYRHKYTYELTDHLGNVRSVVSKLKFMEVATMEEENQTREASIFENVTNESIRQMDQLYNTTYIDGDENHSARLDGGMQAIGPALSKPVSQGDKISFSAQAMYNPDNSSSGVADDLFSLVASVYSVSTVGESSAVYDGLESAMASAGALMSDAVDDIPKAYIMCILFDEQFNEVGTEHVRITEEAAGVNSSAETISGEIEVPENGYAYLYLANESVGQPVNFDDFTVSITGFEVVEMTDYYPFGSVAMQWQSESTEAYRFGYQGQFAEEDEETGYNHFESRAYDPVIGRWMVIDPARQYASGYVGMANNPVMYVDSDGEIAHIFAGAGIGAIVGGVMALSSGHKFGSREFWGSVAGGAVAGALVSTGVGAIGAVGLTGGQFVGGLAVVGGLGNSAGSIVQQSISTGTIDRSKVGSDFVVGAITGPLGYGAGRIIGASSSRFFGSFKSAFSMNITKGFQASHGVSSKVAKVMASDYTNHLKQTIGPTLDYVNKGLVNSRASMISFAEWMTNNKYGAVIDEVGTESGTFRTDNLKLNSSKDIY